MELKWKVDWEGLKKEFKKNWEKIQNKNEEILIDIIFILSFKHNMS